MSRLAWGPGYAIATERAERPCAICRKPFRPETFNQRGCSAACRAEIKRRSLEAWRLKKAAKRRAA